MAGLRRLALQVHIPQPKAAPSNTTRPTFIKNHIQPPASPLMRNLLQNVDPASTHGPKSGPFLTSTRQGVSRSGGDRQPARQHEDFQKERPPGGGPGGLLRGGDCGAGGLRIIAASVVQILSRGPMSPFRRYSLGPRYSHRAFTPESATSRIEPIVKLIPGHSAST